MVRKRAVRHARVVAQSWRGCLRLLQATFCTTHSTLVIAHAQSEKGTWCDSGAAPPLYGMTRDGVGTTATHRSWEGAFSRVILSQKTCQQCRARAVPRGKGTGRSVPTGPCACAVVPVRRERASFGSFTGWALFCALQSRHHHASNAVSSTGIVSVSAAGAPLTKSPAGAACPTKTARL